MRAPFWDIGGHQRSKKAAVIWNAKMEQFVRDDKVLKS
jgi:hypothetical protein